MHPSFSGAYGVLLRLLTFFFSGFQQLDPSIGVRLWPEFLQSTERISPTNPDQTELTTECFWRQFRPSSKYEHGHYCVTFRNIRSCMGKKPIVSVTYENERISGFFPHTNQISNVTQQCRCSPMLIFRSSLGYFWFTRPIHFLNTVLVDLLKAGLTQIFTSFLKPLWKLELLEIILLKRIRCYIR